MFLSQHVMVWMHRMSVADVISFVTQTLVATAVCAFAWWRGGPAERLCAAVFWIAWMVGVAMTLSGPGYDPPLGMLGDAAMAAAFLFGASRHNRPWLGAGLIAQGLQPALRVLDVYLPEPPGAPIWVAVGLGINILNLAMMATLVASTSAWRRRAGDGRIYAA